MSDREKAVQVADDIIADARREDAQKRAGRLHFVYGAFLSREEIERYGADTGLLKAAVRYAHRHWRLRLAVFAFVALLLSAAAVDMQPKFWLYVFLGGGIVGVRSFTRQLVLEYLGKSAAATPLQPS